MIDESGNRTREPGAVKPTIIYNLVGSGHCGIRKIKLWDPRVIDNVPSEFVQIGSTVGEGTCWWTDGHNRPVIHFYLQNHKKRIIKEEKSSNIESSSMSTCLPPEP